MTLLPTSTKPPSRSLEYVQGLGLISAIESAEVLSLFAPDFIFADALRAAESVHVHIKVEDTRALPHGAIRAQGISPESEAEGYVKYPFPGGINMIFSSINISEDDLLAGGPPEFPVMDHKGIDLRSETAPVRAVFDAAPEAARAHGWRHVPQGGEGTPVYCCHTEVKGKHWVYPPIGDATQTRPIEIAFGELEIHGTKMGCDLRPIDPAHPRAAEARAALSACASAHATEDSPNGAAANGTRGSSYYERGDLRRFADVGPGPASVANVLREAGLISGERRGTWIYCRAHSEVLARLQALLVPDETARPVGEADPGVLAYEAASAVGTHQGIGAHLFLPIHVLQGRDDPSTRLGNETGVTSARPKP